MRNTRHPLIVVALAALALASCGCGESAAPPETNRGAATPAPDDTEVMESTTTTPAATEPPATEPPATAVPSGTDTLVLLDAGDEPRSTVRLSMAPGSYGMTMLQAQEIAQTFDDAAQPTVSSAIRGLSRRNATGPGHSNRSGPGVDIGHSYDHGDG
jgi:hypothetical protein